MENLTATVIGVLREREEVQNTNETEAPDNGGNRNRTVVRRVSPLDLAGILNCRRRLEWTKEWLKKNHTEFLSKENLIQEIKFRSNEKYHLNYFFDITERQFRYLVTKLAPVISSYEPQRKKKPFSAEERIAITLKYLATGEVHSCRNYCFRASKPVILQMICNICLNIYELLNDQFITMPKTDMQWQDVISELKSRENLPNCLGFMTMRKIVFYTSGRAVPADYINKPPLILTAIIDGDDNFMYVNVEKTLAKDPKDVYEHSSIKQLIESKSLEFPTDITKSQSDISNMYYFMGTACMPVKTYILTSRCNVSTHLGDIRYNKVYGELCESPTLGYCNTIDDIHMNVEYAFRVLCNMFTILLKPLRAEKEDGRKIVLGCMALYNFLRKTDKAFYNRSKEINLPDKNANAMITANDEETTEQAELTPFVMQNSCLEYVVKQSGDTADGLIFRDRIIKYIADNNLAS